MKITSVTGVGFIENVKCFKPISKVFIKIIYPNLTVSEAQIADPTIRVRLVDGSTGSSKEIVPEMYLSILSEIASKYEGFQRRAALKKMPATSDYYMDGYSLSSVILGAQVDENSISAIDLSNDKYLDIDLRSLDTRCTYEIWGMESHIINPFVRTYSKFYLSAGEIEKSFKVGANEVLVYPINDIKELQMYAKNSVASPVFRREELIIDEDGRNDIVSVGLNASNKTSCNLDHAGELDILFGYSKFGVMSVIDFDSFDVRRENGLNTLTFLMIDTVPSVTKTDSLN